MILLEGFLYQKDNHYEGTPRTAVIIIIIYYHWDAYSFIYIINNSGFYVSVDGRHRIR